jgi:hypothetical protein
MELFVANAAYFYCVAAIAASLIIVSLFAAHRHSDTVGFSLTPLLALALSYDNAAIASAELCRYGTSTSFNRRGCSHHRSSSTARSCSCIRYSSISGYSL